MELNSFRGTVGLVFSRRLPPLAAVASGSGRGDRDRRTPQPADQRWSDTRSTRGSQSFSHESVERSTSRRPTDGHGPSRGRDKSSSLTSPRDWAGGERSRGPPAGRDDDGAGKSSRREKERAAARKAARVADKVAAAERNSKGCCYGCGAPLQTDVPQGPGYVAAEKYAVKKQHKQLDQVLCQRCSDLCNGAMIPAVKDFTQKLQMRQSIADAGSGTAAGSAPAVAPAAPAAGSAGASGTGSSRSTSAESQALELLGKVLISPDQLRAQLTPLALRAAVVVLLVDLTDASGTLMSRVRDMVGRNPIIMVGTKIDLLPEGCRSRDVAEWLSGAAASKRLNVLSVHLVSSHTGEGMAPAVARICRERKSRDVYVVGAANVGKSAFVRAMLKEMARTEPVAIGTSKYLPVESAMPGTTLGLIPLKAFSNGGILFDTPGVHLHHRIPHMLSPQELKLLHPRRRLTVHVPSLPTELTDDDSDETEHGATTAAGGGLSRGAASPSGSMAQGAVGAARPAIQGHDDGIVRKGQGGLKIVNYTPTDDYGLPIEGLDVLGKRGAGGSKRAAGDEERSAARRAAPSGPQQPVQQGAVQATYMWSDLVRVDVLSGPPETALVFYGPATMRVVGLPYIQPEQRLEVEYEGDSGSGGKVLVCTDSVAARGGLQPQELVVRAVGNSGSTAVADVSVSGLPGWIAVWAPRAKKDVRLRVWAPRGVEVILRPSLPCPLPLALQRAWRGERGRGDDVDGDEAEEGEVQLDELSRALAAGGVRDPTLDPQWWESMAALKDEDLPGYSLAAGARRRGQRSAMPARRDSAEATTGDDQIDQAEAEGEDDDLPDWDDEAELLGEDDGEGVEDGETVVVSATVEDILRRPRLDVLAQMDLEDDDDQEAEQAEGGSEDDEDDDDVGSFTFAKRGRGRRVAGPSRDGGWNPVEMVASAPAASASAAPVRAQRDLEALGSRLRRRSTAERAVDVVEEVEAQEEGNLADVADEEEEEEEAEPVTAVRRRTGAGRASAGGARLWLSRRRRRGPVQDSTGEGGEKVRAD